MIAPAIVIELSAEGKALLQRMRDLPDRLRGAVARGVDKATDLTVADIQAKRLTGKGPFPVEEGRLGVKTGKMRQQLYRTPAVITGSGVTAKIGEPLVYAGVHEFGFNGQVHVRAFTRANRAGDRYAREERVSKKTGRPYQARVRIAQGVSFVKAHTRWMQIPARAPIGHGIADNEETFRREIEGAVKEEAAKR